MPQFPFSKLKVKETYKENTTLELAFAKQITEFNALHHNRLLFAVPDYSSGISLQTHMKTSCNQRLSSNMVSFKGLKEPRRLIKLELIDSGDCFLLGFHCLSLEHSILTFRNLM